MRHQVCSSCTLFRLNIVQSRRQRNHWQRQVWRCGTEKSSNYKSPKGPMTALYNDNCQAPRCCSNSYVNATARISLGVKGDRLTALTCYFSHVALIGVLTIGARRTYLKAQLAPVVSCDFKKPPHS